MTNDALQDLVDRFQRRRIDRRGLLKQAAALGVSAAAVGAAIRKAPAVAQGGTKVTFWTTHVEPDLLSLRAIADNFNKENPGTQVEIVQIPPAEVTDVSKLMTAVRGGTGPDVYMLDRFIVAQRAADGLLEDLTPFIGEGNLGALEETYLPFAWAEANFQGKPYALPFDTDVRALYYSKTMLQEAGMDPNEFDPANGAMTLDRVAELALELNQRDASGNYTRMGYVPWFNQGWHYTYGFAFGGKFFDEASCQVTPDDPNVVAAFQWVYDFAKQLDPTKAQPFIQAAMRPGAPPQENPFIQKRLGMQVTGDWAIAHMARYAPDVDYGITFIPVPKQGDQPSSWAGGWSATIPKGAKEPEAGFQFMQYFAGEPGQRLYTKETNHLPTATNLLKDPSLFEERHRFFSDQLLPIAKNRPPLPVGALYWDELTDAWEKTYLNQETPDKALATVKDRVQNQLQRFCPVEIEGGE
ncbi:MAG: ABC transporter substrate-binding protein [Chloroflexota bacterium]|nr:ABC transporter substrate-binding protein [Chloroflexota bacterium]